MRLTTSKGLDCKFEHHVSGKWSKEKCISLRDAWAKHVINTVPEIQELCKKFNIGTDHKLEININPEGDILVASNFDGHKFVNTNIQKCVDVGFHIGAKIQ